MNVLSFVFSITSEKNQYEINEEFNIILRTVLNNASIVL